MELTDESQLLFSSFNYLLKNNIINLKKQDNNNGYNFLINQIFIKLNNIYNIAKKDLCNISNFRSLYKSNTNEFKNIMKNNNDNYFKSTKYISDKIIDYIKTNENKSQLLIYKLPYNNVFIELNFIIYENISPKLLKEFDKYAFNMYISVLLIIILSNNTNNRINNLNINEKVCSKNGLKVFLYLTPFKKKLPNNNDIIGAENVNTGFNFACMDDGLIIIYRKEEFFKVFIHECIHNYGIDGSLINFKINYQKNINNKLIYKKFIENFNFNESISNGLFDIGINESLTEFWTNIIIVSVYLYISYVNKCNNRNLNFENLKNGFERLINVQIIFSIFQVIKILDYNNLDLNKIQNMNIINNYRENTHVLSYYFFKTLLLINYKDFINSNCFTLNKKLLNIRMIENNNNIFLKSLVNYSKQNSFKKMISNVNNLLYELHNVIEDDNNKNILILLNNVKMCVFEI